MVYSNTAKSTRMAGPQRPKTISTPAPFVNNRESDLRSGALRQNFPRA
jgi:hypothetical protein